ncbi:MAG: polysaccharide biosynthesis C-terminal domain-containing protein, partial [Firmicutes bacterium]|nr:polysaccharide biosynthesis C-terminal domain-containing protein [Bacillota bacterium]
LKFIITWTLVAVPAINVLGAAVGTVCAYAFAGIMDTVMLIKFTKVKFPWKLIFVKPLISAVIMGIVTIFVNKAIFALLASNLIATGIAILIAVPLYGVLIIKTKAIRREEIITISIGRKIAKVCDKLRLW